MASIIPEKVIPAMFFIISVDNLQKSESNIPGTLRWQLWHWTQEESDFWTKQRNVIEPLLKQYSNRHTISTEEREKVKKAIKSIREYSSYDVNGHRLLLKIAAFGNNSDWSIANIKFGTPLAKKTGSGKLDATSLKSPLLSVVSNLLGQQLLFVRDVDAPSSTKLPEGIKFAKVYRYIGTEPPQNINEYEFVGNAKRGRLVCTFEGKEFSGNQKIYAYYIARYESKKGELGEHGAMAFAEILF